VGSWISMRLRVRSGYTYRGYATRAQASTPLGGMGSGRLVRHSAAIGTTLHTLGAPARAARRPGGPGGAG
jgi:hypothetical protein